MSFSEKSFWKYCVLYIKRKEKILWKKFGKRADLSLVGDRRIPKESLLLRKEIFPMKTEYEIPLGTEKTEVADGIHDLQKQSGW